MVTLKQDLELISDYMVWTEEFDTAEHAAALVTLLKKSQLYSKLVDASNQIGEHFHASPNDASHPEIITQNTVAGSLTHGMPSDTVIQIVPELRGAFRGSPMLANVHTLTKAFAAMAEHKSIPFEVFAHTTHSFKEKSKPYQQWLDAGKPKNPGRLNALRHIVFKAFSDQPEVLQSTLPVMLFSGLLKENIDGEALVAAGKRLIARPESNKLMLVVGMDYPMDDATEEGNGSQYLGQHLTCASHALYKHGVKVIHIHPDTIDESEFERVNRTYPKNTTALRYPFSIHAGGAEIKVARDMAVTLSKLPQMDQWLLKKGLMEKMPDWFSERVFKYLEENAGRKDRTGEYFTGPDVLDSVLQAVQGIANDKIIDVPGIIVQGPGRG